LDNRSQIKIKYGLSYFQKLYVSALKIFRSKAFIKFILFGALLTFLSQSILLLIIFFLPLSISTALTQILHNYLGYLAYKYGVFKRKGNPMAYILLVLLAWAVQWLLIKTIIALGFSSFFAVIIAIPFLSIFSFITQKFIIFK
tara:strand:- start:31 stop:459 length:429 start_codon:yes stop_codon:yes gene_type:complete